MASRQGRAIWLLFFSFLVAALASARPARADAERDRRYEGERREELSKLDPAMVPVWDRANAARQSQRLAEARSAYAEITKAVPTFDAAHRRLCSVTEDREAALESCRRALKLRDTWENQGALASILMKEPAGRAAARQLLDSAEMRMPSEPMVLGSQAQLALDEQDGERFLRYADRLEHVASGEPQTLAFGTLAALFRGDPDLAHATVEKVKAKEGVDPALVANLEAMIDRYESQWTPLRVLKAFGLLIAVWLAAIAAIYAGGTMLSRATLRATAASNGATDGAAVGGTRMVRRGYGALLSVASVVFFASLPIVGAVIIVGVGAVLYACLAAGRIPIKLILILGVVGMASLWAILKGVYVALRPPRDTDPGEDISLDTQPKLASLLESVAGRIGTRNVDRVFLTPGTELAVYERGGPLRTARGKGERCLILGAGVLRGMRVGSLKSVIAHEFGHFKNEDTAGGMLSLAVRRSMVQMIVALAQSGAAAFYNPAWIFVTRYHGVFLRISQGASRLQEVLADRWAVFAYGSKPFVEGFEHVVKRSVEHDIRTQATLKEVIEGDLALANFYTHEAQSPVDVEEVAERVREARERPADPFDSHPPPKDRVEAAIALSIEHSPEEGDDEDAWQLFENAADLEERLTSRICDAIAENHNVTIRRSAASAPE